MNSSVSLLSITGITKRFGTLLALDGVDLDVQSGEIHAVIGENGAGKSTLMNCIFGLVTPDEGTIRVADEEVRVSGPREALSLGIGMVHQHFKLVPSLTVTENIFLGRELSRAGVIDRQKQRARVLEISERFGLEVDPDSRIKDLSVGARQRVEILRSLLEDARVLILDEPTAVLTPQEAESLFRTLREIVASGLGVIFITHHLDEVISVADRVTVLRHGRMVAHDVAVSFTEHQLAELIVGEEIESEYPERTPPKLGAQVLEISQLRVISHRGVETTKQVNLTVAQGEIVGVVGVPGNGQSELVEAIVGLRTPTSGSIRISGKDVTGASPREIRQAGLAHIAEDRNARGISLFSSVADNFLLGNLKDPRFGKFLLNRRAIAEVTQDLIHRFNIRVSHQGVLARRLSGGNAQKVVIARELSQAPSLIVAAEPVRGLDIAATRFVYEQLVEQRNTGVAVIIFSTELSDLMAVSDRLLVMHAGGIVGEFTEDRPSELEISKLMLGVGSE